MQVSIIFYRSWSSETLTEEMKNIQIESLRDTYDPFVLRLIEKFKDPSGQHRKPYVLLIDSTKIPIMKSGDQEVQKRTFYGKKDGHYVTFTVSSYLCKIRLEIDHF